MKLWLAVPLIALVAHAAPARMQISAKEFSYALSRTHLHPGSAVVELVNFGQDPHDLRVQRVGARHIAGTPTVAPGAHADLTLKLQSGRYVFWCSIANHRQLGMRGTLVVR